MCVCIFVVCVIRLCVCLDCSCFLLFFFFFFFFFQAEDGIRDLVRSRGLGDVYKRQTMLFGIILILLGQNVFLVAFALLIGFILFKRLSNCLLYTSDAADDLLCVDLGGRRIIKKKKQN